MALGSEHRMAAGSDKAAERREGVAGRVRRVTRRRVALAGLVALAAGAAAQPPENDAAVSGSGGVELVPAAREERIELGRRYPTAEALFDALRARANGGAPLSLTDMPDWSGLWTRVGPPFFDPEPASAGELTTAKLKPGPLAELAKRRELSAQGIEYDPISDCSPPGFPRWLAIPFLREFTVTPSQTYLFSETVNNLRRIYTDGRSHPPAEDGYPLYYGDSIGFWAGHTLVIHTSQVAAGIFHRNDPTYSEALEAVEVWRAADPQTMLVDVWVYDPETLLEPWHVRQTYQRVPNPDGYLRIDYWFCGENPNNAITQTAEGTSQFTDFTFDD